MPLTPAMIARNVQLVEKNVRAARPSSKEKSYSEEIITPELSLTVSAVLAAFTILSEDLSSLPLLLYERRDRNKFRAYDSLYYRLMHDQPNPEHTSMVFRELIEGHLLAWGNFYGQLIIDEAGDVQEIWPLRPDRMTVERIEGERIYKYQTANGKPRIFFSDELCHIPAFGFDGLIGYSRIALARNAIGLAISTEKYGSKFFSNGANFDIAIIHPETLSDDAYKHLDESIKEKHTNVENSHKPMILEEGMSIEKIGIPPDDAQFLETRKFQVSEIARIFRVPPHMIGDVERTTSWGTGIDGQEQGYVNHTLRPWAIRIEEHLNARVLPERDRGVYFYEHLMDGLLRGDIATRYEAYVKAINNGIMSPNEVRAKENMNSYKEGDTYWRPLNMTSADGNGNMDGATKGGDPNVSTKTTSANAAPSMMPLLKDAADRIIRREVNEIENARKRYVEKGKAEKFTVWAKEFYKHDYPEFLLQVLSPFSLSYVLEDEEMRSFIKGYCEQREESALDILDADVGYSSATVDQVIAMLNVYAELDAEPIAVTPPAEKMQIVTQPLTVNITNQQPAMPPIPGQPAHTFNIQNDINMPDAPKPVPQPASIVNIQNDIHVPETPVNVQNDIHVPEPPPPAEQHAPIVNIQNDVYIPDPPARKLKLTKKGDTWTGEAK